MGGGILLAAILASAGHLVGHDYVLAGTAKELTKADTDLQKDFYEKLQDCHEKLSGKMTALAAAIERVNDNIQSHEGKQGIHQTPDEKAAITFKTATEVVDKRIGRLEGQIEVLQKEIRAFMTTERETIVERLLRLETQQEVLIRSIDELRKELKNR